MKAVRLYLPALRLMGVCFTYALMLLVSTAQAANYSCSIGTISGVTLNYDPNTLTATTATGSVRINCSKSGSGSGTVFYELGSNGGIRASGSQSRVQSGANTINYGLWKDASYTQAWTDVSSNRLKGSLSSSSSNTSVTVNFYFLIPAQQNAAAGSYTDTQTFRLYQGNSANVASTTTSSTSANSTVRVVTLAQCRLSSSPGNILFNYTSFQTTSASATTSFAVTCVSGVPYTMALDDTAGSLLGLDYSLALSSTSRTGSGAAQSVTISASMSAGQAGICSTGSCTASEPRTLTISY